MEIKCPYCGNEGVPVVTKEVSVAGWVIFIALILVCLPLCWIPFVVDGCKEEKRKCVACGCKFG